MKIGAILTALGSVFIFLGILLFFDRGLLAIGNLTFLAGVTLVLGFWKTQKFLMQPKKLRGTICFLGGILMVLYGWTLIGLIIEIFGFVNLFGNFFPVVLLFLRRLPIIGNVLNHPAISRVADKLVDTASLPQ